MKKRKRTKKNERQNNELDASAANRTRGPSMATMDFTTKPLMLFVDENTSAYTVPYHIAGLSPGKRHVRSVSFSLWWVANGARTGRDQNAGGQTKGGSESGNTERGYHRLGPGEKDSCRSLLPPLV
ncbi:hypothetical protein GGR56DRAFT_627593 [Xylariaceae sp. FL0804]|nr:hypothetical protein GGR56DRAFT_627593 [Xylariaceae sp. FL0804]